MNLPTSPESELSPFDQSGPEGADSLKSRLSALRAWLRVWVVAPDPDADTDNRFPQTQDELVDLLKTDDPDRASEILVEAREIAARMVDDRIDGVERRAATLQTTTAIAGSFSLAGGALVATDVRGAGWQIVIGAVLLWVTLNLGICGWRATQATADIQRFVAEPAQDILNRPKQSSAEASVQRAARILRVAGFNARFARIKVTQLKRAGRHLAWATLGLPVIVAAVLAYLVAHPNVSGHHTTTRTVVLPRLRPPDFR